MQVEAESSELYQHVGASYRRCFSHGYFVSRSPYSILNSNQLPVAFIPEGLPIAVTLSLAKVAHTLSKHKVLCK